MKTLIITSAILIIVCLLFTIFGCGNPQITEPATDIITTEELIVTVNNESTFNCIRAEYNSVNNSIMFDQQECGIEILLNEIQTIKIEPK